MITITSIKDPFKPEENIKFLYDYIEGENINFYLSKHFEKNNIDISNKDINYYCTLKNSDDIDLIEIDLNGPLDIIVEDNSIICITCNIEGELAAVVASWVASTLFPTTAGILGFGNIVGYTIAYGATYLATTFAVGYGLSKLASSLAPDPPSLGDGRGLGSVDQTYGWGTLQQTEGEGVRIPYIFGSNKISGHIINQFITIQDSNETLNILLGVCDHEIDSIEDIRINNQPYTSYRDVEVFTRLGTNSDTSIPGFDEIVTQNTVGSKLNQNSGVVISTDGDQVDKIRVAISAPKGMYYSNDLGTLNSTVSKFDIEYRVVGDVSWILYSNETIVKSSTEPLQFTYDIDNLIPNQYEIRITRTNDENTIIASPSGLEASQELGFRGKNEIYFSFFQEIIKQNLIYPRLGKYAVKALATDQLSGSVPNISCIAKRNYVDVYNEDSGYWEEKRATNPAWIVYSLLNEFAGIDKSKIIYDDFRDWADYCDELINGSFRFDINTIVYDSNFWDEIQKIAKLGRAAILRRGTRYGVFIDKESTEVSDMFSMGNIVDGSFSIQYLPKKDRANAVEIEYSDVDRDYERQVITIYSDDYLSGESNPQKSNISIKASITQEQAIREGVYRINSNKFFNRVITFDAFIDSFAATVGDLIYFQHFIPDYSLGLGGRIVDAGNDDGSGNPYVQIDQEFEIESGKTYTILVRLEDNSIVEKVINNSPGVTDIFTLTTSWITVPTIILGQKQPTFIFGDVNFYKKVYRLTSCSRRDDFIRTLICTEYVQEIYTNNDGFIIDEVEDEIIVQRATEVTLEENLIFSEFGDYRSEIAVSWTTIKSGGFDWVIWIEDLTANTSPIKVTNTGVNTALIDSSFLVKGNQYLIYINTIDEGPVNFFSNVRNITIQGKDILPDSITSFFLQNNQLVWEYPGIEGEIAGYRLKAGSGSNVSWTYADFLNNGEFVTSPYSIEPRGETTTYLLKAYDYEGLESEFPATLVTNIGDIIVQNVVEETILSPPFDGDITNGQVISDVLYSINNGDFWTGDSNNNIWKGVPGEVFFDTQYLEMTYIDRFVPIYPDIPVIIDVDANAPTGLLIFYRESQTTSFWEGNSTQGFWSGNTSNSFWDSSGADFRLLPTPVNLTDQQYEIKVVTNSGFEISSISSININYDFPDIVETFEDISISASGTRIPITKEYQIIKNVGLTLQDDGGDATSLIIADKDIILGPLIYAEDKDRIKTTATIDCRIQGY